MIGFAEESFFVPFFDGRLVFFLGFMMYLGLFIEYNNN